MKSLWLKDRTWILTFVIVGAIGLSIATMERGFLELFVLGPRRLEILFYSAGAAGLVLGGIAVLWDELLGTREFLMQRPISRKSLFQSRLFWCLAIIASWMVTVPLLAWVQSAYWSGIFDLSYWAGLPEILSTLQIAWPMCAIGCFAAALPAPWWLRLTMAVLLTLTVGIAIDLVTKFPGGETSVLVFAIACWSPAAVLFLLSARLDAQHADPDRPWSSATRFVAGTALVVSLGYITGGLAREAQSHSVRSLQWEYPRIIQIDKAIKLAVRGEHWTKLAVADTNHKAVSAELASDGFQRFDFRAGRFRELFEIEAPRFHDSSGGSTGWVDSRVLVGRDGRAWLHREETGEVLRIGIGPELADFPRAVRPRRMEDVGAEPNRYVVIAGDQESGKLWRFDGDLGYFVPWPLPDGDRFVRLRYLRGSDRFDPAVSASTLLVQLLERGGDLKPLQGTSASYVLKDGELVSVGDLKSEPNPRVAVDAVVHGNDPLEFSVEVPAHDGLPLFRHDFEPRTVAEIGYAASAMLLATIRPPLTQVASSLLANDQSADAIWLDRIVCGGKRVWLLLSGIALSVGCALLLRRRLRRIGVDPAVCKFWVIATVVAGPLTAVLAILCESVRKHARPVFAAPSPPRIVSVPEREEIPA